MRSLIQKLLASPLLTILLLGTFLLCSAIAGVYAYAGAYGINVILRRGGSVWVSVKVDDARLSAPIRSALSESPPNVDVGAFEWRRLVNDFDVAELPVVAASLEMDRILLARINPDRFRFEVRNAPAGDKELGDWMKELGAALVINGSYYSRYGIPDTPVVSAGVPLGPLHYDAKHGAFVASATDVGIRDLGKEDWHVALRGVDNAMVSYPLLLAEDGSSRVTADQRWLANRSFVGKDSSGRIILGTTMNAFFSLDRLADFLRRAPLDLTVALNLDGGPVACQGIALNNYQRDFCGAWELAVRNGDLQLLQPMLGTRRWALPIVLAVYRR